MTLNTEWLLVPHVVVSTSEAADFSLIQRLEHFHSRVQHQLFKCQFCYFFIYIYLFLKRHQNRLNRTQNISCSYSMHLLVKSWSLHYRCNSPKLWAVVHGALSHESQQLRKAGLRPGRFSLFKPQTPRYFSFSNLSSSATDLMSSLPGATRGLFWNSFMYTVVLPSTFQLPFMIAAAQAISTTLTNASKNSTMLEIKEIAFSTRQSNLIKWYTWGLSTASLQIKNYVRNRFCACLLPEGNGRNPSH